MKKHLFLYVLIFLSPLKLLYGQDAFNRTKNVTAGDITFLQRTSQYVIGYSNILNKWINAPYLQFKDGTPLDEYDYDAFDLKSSQASFDQAIRMTFTKKEMDELKNNPPARMTFYYVVSPEGETLEVAFIIPKESKILTDLPPEKFALLEKNLKKYLKWTVDDFGKTMLFLHAWRIVDFPTMKIQYPLFPSAGGTVGSQSASQGTFKLP